MAKKGSKTSSPSDSGKADEAVAVVPVTTEESLPAVVAEEGLAAGVGDGSGTQAPALIDGVSGEVIGTAAGEGDQSGAEGAAGESGAGEGAPEPDADAKGEGEGEGSSTTDTDTDTDSDQSSAPAEAVDDVAAVEPFEFIEVDEFPVKLRITNAWRGRLRLVKISLESEETGELVVETQEQFAQFGSIVRQLAELNGWNKGEGVLIELGGDDE